jgi:carbon-monoxide dehydrogenase medium subunit
VVLLGAGGERTLPLADFLVGPGTTALQPGELLRGVEVPEPPPETGFSYQRISGRSAVDMVAASAAARVSLAEGTCAEARIVMGSVGPTALRARRAEAMLQGEKLTLELARDAGLEAAREARPITDVRAFAEWRRTVVAVLVTRALVEAARRAGEARR